jgi:hypothetical protein
LSAVGPSGHAPLDLSHQDFEELAALESDLLLHTGGRERFEEKLRSFFRSAIDEVIDTARTGRFFLSDLEKTEKTYLGTKFEILLRDWLGVPKGVVLDLLIGGKEVDVKTTTGGGYGWMIPPEAINQLCILLRINEDQAKCAVGLFRARPAYLNTALNRDKKASVSKEGRHHIWWVASDFSYTQNFWSTVGAEARMQIMACKGGTARLVMLFQLCLGVPVSRVQVAAVAAQDDYMKRIRRNGGARDVLEPKGIAILYSEDHRDLMLELGLTFGSREFVSYDFGTRGRIEELRRLGKLK